MPLNLYIKKEDVIKTGLKLEERNDAFFNLHIGTEHRSLNIFIRV